MKHHRYLILHLCIGGDETVAPSQPVRSQTQQQREVYVGDDLPPKSTSNKKKSKAPSITPPTITTTKPPSSLPSPISTDHSQNFSVPDTVSKHHERTSTSDSLFGLSTIKENILSPTSPSHQTDDEIDKYFNQIKQPNEPKKTKSSAPIIPQSKEQKRSTRSQSDDIQTPATSISVKPDTTSTSSTTNVSAQKQSDDAHDSTDEDVDELLGKLEVSFSGKYTHTYIHTELTIFFTSKNFLSITCCLLLYVCAQCIFP